MTRSILLVVGATFASMSGCVEDKGGKGDDTSTDDTATSDDTAASDDTGASDDTAEPAEPEWTQGPELPDCEPQEGDGDRVLLSGVVLTAEGPQAGSVVYSRSSGEIVCVGNCDPTSADVVCTEGVISPGLVDPHNHLQYNVIPPWQHDRLFEDRYDWRSDGDYWDYRTAYDAIADDYVCEIMKWAELRDLVGGATSAVGSTGGSCIDVLVRNLDEGYDEHGFTDFDLYYSASTVTDRFDESDGEYYTAALASGDYDAVLNHVAEGVGGSGSSEMEHMFDVGMAGPGEQWIHATDATTLHFARMLESGAGIIWSPRSNLDLYGDTTNADVAMRMGVPVALGPDWTWSGSLNEPRELVCAYEFLRSRDWQQEEGGPKLDERLWQMATTDAARAVGLDGRFGALEVGFPADIAVFTWSAEPYRAIVEAGAEDVRLVVIDGDALFGVPDLVEPLTTLGEWCETVTPCTEERLLCVRSASGGDDAQTYADLESALSAALAAAPQPEDHPYAGSLHGLWMCEEERASCDLSEPASGDDDGDGVADTSDLCPLAWDPLQADYDGDGVGDVCDPCPLNPVSDTCPSDTDDVDGDGVPNDEDLCPYLYDDGSDRDGDGTGDACDACPDQATGEGEGCTTTIRALRDPADPNHPSGELDVEISGAVVVGVRSGNGFYVQDPAETEYGGLYVYDSGAATVAVGDVVTVVGTYMEYHGLTEVAYATTTVTGSTTPPEPLVVADPCLVGTGGSLAEPYESMLVVVGGLEVSDSNPDDPDDFDEFEVNGCLRVDDELYADLVDAPAVGTTFASLTGVLTYRYDNSKVVPRGEDDVVE